MKFEGYRGKYYKIDEIVYGGKMYTLWESELYGDETPAIVASGSEVIDETRNTLSEWANDYFEI